MLKKFIILLSGFIIGLIFPLIFIYLNEKQLGENFTFDEISFIVKSQDIYLFSILSFPLIFTVIAHLFVKLFRSNQSLIYANHKIKEEQKKSAINSKFASLGVLSAGIGHEINNPLSILNMNAMSIQKKLKELDIEDETLDKKLQVHFKTVDRIVKIVNGLRSMARNDVDTLEYIEADTYIEDTINMVSEIYKKDSIEIQLFFQSTSSVIYANNGKLQQIILNFLSNSKDAILEKSDFGKIIIKTYNKDNNFCLEIEDNGAGISTENQKRIFDTFFTTKTVGKGTGMGLSISLDFIKEMDGQIEIDSELGKGTVFKISFNQSNIPKEKLNSNIQRNIDIDKNDFTKAELDLLDEDSNLYSQFEEDEELNLNGCKVLLVEDELVILDILADFLEKIGCEVIKAKDGIDGLEKVKMSTFDVIITDLQMPRMKGKPMIEHIRLIEKIDTPILITTGGSFDESLPDFKSMKNLTQGYITKPYSEFDIYQTISKVIKK